jgi:hypothetical protein
VEAAFKSHETEVVARMFDRIDDPRRRRAIIELAYQNDPALVDVLETFRDASVADRMMIHAVAEGVRRTSVNVR